MSIENIEQLINSLQYVKKQLVEQNQISSLDKEVLKKRLLQFYETTFFNSTSEVSNNQEPISTTPINTLVKEVNTIVEPIKEEIPIRNNNVAPTIIEEEPISFMAEKIVVDEPIPTTVNIPTPIPTKEIVSEEDQREMIFSNTTQEEPITVPNQIDTNSINEPANAGLNDKFTANTSSLNERFQSSSSIADKFEKSNKSMNEIIDLNKRLLFVDVLFNGNIQLYNQVLQHIDDYKSASEAIHFVEFNKAKLQINEKKETVYKSFLEIIQKKFS
ncbi:MAG: hypothetical protein WCP57_02560 [Bacteroidota bacterium]